MKVESREELAKLIKLMRKTGVESLKSGDFELKLSPYEPEARTGRAPAAATGDDTIKVTPRYSEEDVLFWSSTPPGEEPPKDA